VIVATEESRQDNVPDLPPAVDKELARSLVACGGDRAKEGGVAGGAVVARRGLPVRAVGWEESGHGQSPGLLQLVSDEGLAPAEWERFRIAGTPAAHVALDGGVGRCHPLAARTAEPARGKPTPLPAGVEHCAEFCGVGGCHGSVGSATLRGRRRRASSKDEDLGVVEQEEAGDAEGVRRVARWTIWGASSKL